MPRTKTRTLKNKSRKNKSTRTKSTRNKSTTKRRKGGVGFWSSKSGPVDPNDPNAPPPKKQSEGFSSVSHFTDYAKGSLKASRSAMNMPLTLATMNYKINALMVKNGVNYKFSNGYTAKDYTIDKVSGEAANEGRGELKPNAVRGKITGVQSGLYTTAMESDTYDKVKKKNEESKLKKANAVPVKVPAKAVPVK
jgi:hypothetical protein